jgi:hypothetical protein
VAPRPPINDGSAYDPSTGKLRRFVSAGAGVIEVVRYWPEPRAWLRIGEGAWRGESPYLDLVDAEAAPSRAGRPRTRRFRANLRAAVSTIPEPVRAILRTLPPRVQWRCLSLFARADGALELAASNPALAVALACSRELGVRVKRPLRSARALLRRRRRDIAGWLGFPPTAAAVRVLSRLPPGDCDPSHLLHLRALLSAEPRTVLHLRALNAGVLQLLGHPRLRPLIAPSLVEACAAMTRSRAQRLAQRIEAIESNAGFLGRGGDLPLLRSARDVHRLSRELDRARRVRGARRRVFAPFPPAPFPDGALGPSGVTVEAIRGHDELVSAGREDHNCLADPTCYPVRIAEGLDALYRVRWEEDAVPQRALLRLSRPLVAGAFWHILELFAPCNQVVTPWVREALQAWVDEGHRTGTEWRIVHPPSVRWIDDHPWDRPRAPREEPDPRQLLLPLPGPGPMEDLAEQFF